ncbi:MAG TPA: thermonuclease family protein [Clostridiaceae bacterium]|nr:thermonuclease family protein [Clostridiaceae bacterium]
MRRKTWNNRILPGLLLVLTLTFVFGKDALKELGLISRFDSGGLEDFAAVRVAQVIDGDTVRLSDGTTVRMVGMNTPETSGEPEAYGEHAKAYAREVLENRTVYLERDVSETDQFGRALRYLWLDRPERIDEESIRKSMFNAMALAEGFAQPYTFPPDVRYADLFMEIATEARDEGKGLWSISRQGTTRGTVIPD